MNFRRNKRQMSLSIGAVKMFVDTNIWALCHLMGGEVPFGQLSDSPNKTAFSLKRHQNDDPGDS